MAVFLYCVVSFLIYTENDSKGIGTPVFKKAVPKAYAEIHPILKRKITL